MALSKDWKDIKNDGILHPMKRKIVIMGAAGRDFHNFNVFYRDNEEYEVVAFTATQIPNIASRTGRKALSRRNSNI